VRLKRSMPILPTASQNPVADFLPLLNLFHNRITPLARAVLADKRHTLTTEAPLFICANEWLQESDLLTMGASEGVVLNRSGFWVYQN
jgi:hypothetical protein